LRSSRNRDENPGDVNAALRLSQRLSKGQEKSPAHEAAGLLHLLQSMFIEAG
jgi:hypothetical protein